MTVKSSSTKERVWDIWDCSLWHPYPCSGVVELTRCRFGGLLSPLFLGVDQTLAVAAVYQSLQLHQFPQLVPGAIQDLWLGGSWVGEGSGDRLRSPAVQGRALVGDQRGGEAPRKLWSLRNYRHLFERQFWTNHTIFIRPKNLTLSLNFVG